MSKDLALAMRAARMEGVPTPLGQLSSSIYEALGRSEDFKDKDFGIAFRALAGALGRSEFREEYSEKTEKEMASKAGQRSA